MTEVDQLAFYKDNLKIKEEIIEDYKKEEELWKNTEADHLARIANQDQELKAKIQEFQASNGELLKRIEELESKGTAELPEDYEDLISERDEAIREKKTLEQDRLLSQSLKKPKIKRFGQYSY